MAKSEELWACFFSTEGPRKLAARDKLLQAYEPLAKSLVYRFRKNTSYYTSAMRDDLLQAARIGVWRSIEDYDPAKGAFSTHCWWRVLREMQRVVQYATPITIRKNAHLSKRVQERQSAVLAKTGEEATKDELGISERAWQNALCAQPTFVPSECANTLTEVEDPGHCDDDVDSLREYTASLSAREQKALLRRMPGALAKARKAL